MIKRIYLSLLLVIMCLISIAAPITQEQALRTAQALLNTKLHATNISFTSSRKLSSLSNINSLPAFYFFDTEDGARVIVAADDCAYPILGYLDHIPDQETDMPDNMLNWLDGYVQQIEYARTNNIQPTSDIKTAWQGQLLIKEYSECSEYSSLSPRRLPYTIGPLMTTRWNQSAPYNNLVPGGYPTGCVATAMAQIMCYWQYPYYGMGERAYIQGQQLHKADFSNTTYNWELMPQTLSDDNSAAEIEAVATLMYHCGVATRMTYNNDGSGTYVIESYSQRGDDNAEYAFKNFFDYTSSMHGIMRDRKSSTETYTDDEWNAMIRQEIDEGRPVLYSGYGKDENEAYYGHAFVCDGYTSLGLYHMNWGWGGAYDGWFKLNALKLSGVGIGGGQGEFNYMQHALFGIEPNFSQATGIDNINQSPPFEPLNISDLTSDDIIYTLQGVRINHIIQPGLYIINGKKVCITN